MRIAYVCADAGVPVFGQKGCSIHVQEVMRSLQRQGAQVELFANRLGGNPPADLATIPIHLLPKLSRLDRAVREQVALSANPDLYRQLELMGSFDLVYERYSLWSFAAMEYAREANVPGLLEVNAPLIEEQAKHRGLVDRASAETVARRVFKAATGLIAVSTPIQLYLANYVSDSTKIHVIPNGVNPQRFPADLHLTTSSRSVPFTVGFVGTLKPWHGLPILLDAFTQLHAQQPQIRLLIVGDGPERERLQTEVGDRNLQSVVHFTGAVPPEQVPKFLAAMDVAVAPYPDQPDFYFSPLKVYEYMAAGLPVVASRIGQLSELIEDSVTGVLCPPGDPVAFAEAIARLYRSPKLRHQIGQTAREKVLQHHTWDTVAQQILSLAGLRHTAQRVEVMR